MDEYIFKLSGYHPFCCPGIIVFSVTKFSALAPLHSCSVSEYGWQCMAQPDKIPGISAIIELPVFPTFPCFS